jgi:hypothetical protein
MSDATATPLYCANHPDRETSLRCNRCEKPICAQCAVLTPTGYRCRECVALQQKAFETARWFDYPLAIATGGVLSFLGSLLAARLGFFALLLAPGAGVVIAGIIRALVRRRRSRRLFMGATIAVAIGSLPYLIFILALTLGGVSRGGFGGLFSLLWQGYYAFAVTSTVYYQLSGIRLGR